MKPHARSWMILLLALVAGNLATSAQEAGSEAYQDEYQSGDYARIRSFENGASVLRGAPDGGAAAQESAALNTPLFPGDTLRTDERQRVEIELAGGTLLRLDRGSELALEALPAPSAEYTDNTVLKLYSGTLEIASPGGERGELRVDTPTCSVYPMASGDARIDVDRDGRAHVASRRGVVEVVGDEGSVLVRSGMRTVVDPHSVPEDPRAFNTFAADGFERYVAELETPSPGSERADAAAQAYQELPGEVRPYYRELSAYGSWVNLPSYGYVWSPYDRASGFRPYLDGSWYYGPRGYFWVSSEPWGWAPYHYGRWTWAPGYGWCWIPGHVFGGAWVSWSWGTTHVGWCPLDYWNRPAYHETRYYGAYDPACWTFVSYPNFAARGYRRYAVPVERIGSTALRGSALVTRAPRIAPSDLARDPGLRQRALHSALALRGARLDPSAPTRPTRSFAEVEREVRRPAALRPNLTQERWNRARVHPLEPRARQQESVPNPGAFRPRPRTLPGVPESAPAARPRLEPSERLRDMYRRMASPRVTRERGQEREVRSRPEPAARAKPTPPVPPPQAVAPPPAPLRPRAPEARPTPNGRARRAGGEKKK